MRTIKFPLRMIIETICVKNPQRYIDDLNKKYNLTFKSYDLIQSLSGYQTIKFEFVHNNIKHILDVGRVLKRRRTILSIVIENVEIK